MIFHHYSSCCSELKIGKLALCISDDTKMIKATFYQVFMPIGFFPWVPGALLVIRVSSLVVKKLKTTRMTVKVWRSVLAQLEVTNSTARKFGMFFVRVRTHVFVGLGY